MIAICSFNDRHYEKAKSIAIDIKKHNIKLITTHAVILEIANALSKKRYRHVAIQLIKSMESDPDITIVSYSEDLYKRAFKLYQERLDKEWGLTDCMSFLVMKDYDLRQALTADKHFQQAGFRINSTIKNLPPAAFVGLSPL